MKYICLKSLHTVSLVGPEESNVLNRESDPVSPAVAINEGLQICQGEVERPPAKFLSLSKKEFRGEAKQSEITHSAMSKGTLKVSHFHWNFG